MLMGGHGACSAGPVHGELDTAVDRCKTAPHVLGFFIAGSAMLGETIGAQERRRRRVEDSTAPVEGRIDAG